MMQIDLLNTYSDLFFLIALFVFVLGASMGSFINVVVDRLIHGQSLMGRSHCDYCKKTLAWYDLIPIISYIVLRGKCRKCHRHLSFQYPLIEVLTGVLFVITWLSAPFPYLLLYWGIVSCAWVILLSDLRYQLISDYMQVALFVSIFLFKVAQGATIFNLLADVVSGAVVAVPIGLIYVISRERAMGQGDVLLAAQIGFLLGTIPGYLALYSAFVLGAAVGIFLLITGKRKMKSAVPFGPFLIIGTLIVIFWGRVLTQGALHLLGR